MKLCTCFWRTTSCCPFINQGLTYFIHRSFYSILNHKELLLRGRQLDLVISWSSYILSYICATYRSLYLLSCVALVTLCDVLFYTSSLWKASSLVRTSKSYLLQLKKTLIFANAANSTELLSLVLHQGLNVRWLIHLVNDIYRNGRRSEGLVIKISAMLNSSLAIHYLLCLRSFTFYRLPRICHYRYMNLASTLGSIGVACVVVCWIQ